ncbi:MAG TPA: hypothetical protein VM370_11855 [Candidatus Thermoplasmatota archaeon]|nr:hypothetical protein [Candidatus Thermoplasmatota archaeon]
MGRRALAIAALFLLPLAAAPLADACAVPCGRIYPLILIQVDGDATMWNLTHEAPVTIDATLTYKFDMVNEGYTVATPNEPVEIRFEYPRLPDWAQIRVEPEVIPVDVNNPTYAQPETSEPTNPQAQYVYTVPIQITLTLLGQPVLKDGYDYAKLLVFAKSSESGLYQSGYGIKELRTAPEGALHESDVAGQKDVFTAAPLPTIALSPVETSFDGTSVTLTPPEGAKFWEPSTFTATVSPAPAGRMVFAVHDEAGALVASTPPLDASSGEARLNVTLAHPGRHTATVTLLPDAGSATPPITYPLDFDVGTLGAEGYAYPKSYVVQTTEDVPLPLASTADPLAQFQRDIPFFLFETAQSAAAQVTLVTPGTPVDLGRSLANLQFSVHDPDGNMLQAGSVDPTKPTWSVRVGSVPVDGWYVLRIKGVGAPIQTRYDARIEVNYAAAHQARSRADGAPDLTGGVRPISGANLTLPVDTLAPWSPSDLTPSLDDGSPMTYSVTVYDPNGTLAYASGLREGAASFSAPEPGTYRAYVYAQPTRGAVPFSPQTRAFTFDVGRGNVTIATTFAIEDAFEAPVAAADTVLGYHAIHVLPGAGAPTVAGGEIVDADGASAAGDAPGVYFVRVAGRGAPPSGSAISVTLEQTYTTAVSLVGPGRGDDATSGLPIPGLAVGLVLAAIGALAVGIALVRR